MKRKDRKWWEKKWYWVLCILLPLVLVPAIHLFFFPETPLGESLVYAIASSVGILVAYFAYMGKPLFKIQPKTLRRIIFISFGAFTIGPVLWTFTVFALAFYFDILDKRNPIVFLSLFIFMVVSALIMDIIMKRRDYRPFIEGRGNI